MEEKKLHYKMYKDGKKFVFAAIATLSIFVAGGISTVEVHADTVSGNSTAAASSASDTKSAAPSTATTAVSSASDTKSAAPSTATTAASSASDTKSAAPSTATTAASSAIDTKSAVPSTTAAASSASDTKSAAPSTATTAASSAIDTKSAAPSIATTQQAVQVSYKDIINKLDAATGSASTEVTKDNFLQYFVLNGSATYDQSTGIVTLTPDSNNQVGNFALKSKIDTNSSFTLTGQVNLGSNPNGADGISFAFHNGNTSDLGNSGGNLGIGGLLDALGFKLDTWPNGYQAPQSNKNGSQIDPTDSNGFGWNGDSMSAPYGTFVTTSDQQIKSKDGSSVQRWWAEDLAGSAQSLSKSDLDGHFHDFVVKYDGTTRQLTISYTETSGKVLTWSTTVSNSYQAIAMIVSASTGGAKNLQQFKITSFNFHQAATVNVKYVDTEGNQIAQGEVSYPEGTNVNGTYSTEQLTIPNYTFVKMGDDSLPASGTLTNAGVNGTVIYVYTPSYIATTETKTVNETVHYVYKDGTTAHDDYVATPVEFTRQVSTNAVTGEKTYGAWSAEQTFATVTSPAIKGYTPDQTEIGTQTVSGDSKDLDFTVVYTKDAPTVTTETKTVNETVHYVYKDGTTAHDDYVATPVEFTRQVSTDAVTGEKTYGAWSAEQTFAAVTSPAIKGYTPDQTEIGTQTASGDSKDLDFTVVYTKDAPAKPGNPSEPIIPTKPGNPNSSQPGNPFQPSNATNNGVINTSTNTGSKVNNGAVNSPELPQTGENNSQSQTTSFVGILLATFGSLLGFLGIKKRRND